MSRATTLLPIRSEEELTPQEKKVGICTSNVKVDPEEHFTEPLHQLGLAILKTHIIYDPLTLIDTDGTFNQLKLANKGIMQYSMKIPYVMLNETTKEIGMHKKSRASRVRKTGGKVANVANEVKETYVDDSEQVRIATLLSVDSERHRREGIRQQNLIIKEEINDEEMSGVKEKGWSLGDVNDMSNYTVFVHDKQKEAKEKQTPIFKPLIPPRTRSSQDDVLFNPNMHLTPWETLTRGLIPGGNPELTSCISVENPASTLVINVVADFIRPSIHNIVMRVLHTKQISLTTTPRLSITNITIPLLKEKLLDIMLQNLESIEGKVNLDFYNALSNSVQHDKGTTQKYSCKEAKLRKRSYDDQDPPKNHKGGRKLLKSENKERKYALSITKRLAIEYNIKWIEEDIGSLFRKTISEYDEDVVLGIHHWSKINDGVVSKTTKENVKSLYLKAKVTKEQDGDDNDSQGGGDEDEDEEFNFMASKF
ncbi:hypothetical protein Tco_0581956 [Tanacetum coccineum]